MSLQLSTSFFCSNRNSNCRNSSFARFSVQAVSLGTGARRLTSDESHSLSLCFEEARERIAKLIYETELSVSPYDTAWVAMVPSLHSFEEPYFPGCVDWLLENQCQDGSWARPHHHRLLQRDVLSSTLACVLALKKWGVGREQIDKGVHFIESNFASAIDKSQISPLGFEIVFPGMLEYARELLLNLHLEPKILNELTRKRDFELQSHLLSENMAYVAEGVLKSRNCESILKYQRKNASLFNSPSTTAAAFIHLKDYNCLNYLSSALKKFGNAVPAIYPLEIYCRLSTIDNLGKLGISSNFASDIQSSLDEIYRSWLQGEEEIFMDASTCALAFRILRMNGYDVTTGSIIELLQEDGHTKDIQTTLELYKASEVLLAEESHLQKQNLRLKKLLEEELSKGSVFSGQLDRNIDQEVNHILDRPFYAILERIANRRNIENYQLDSTRILKTSYFSPNFGNNDFLFMSAVDFNRRQKIQQEELKELERWVIENKLDELKFARSKAAYCYFSAAATTFSPEQLDARISWAKNGVLTTVVDDFFDVGGSVEELKKLIQLIEAWDVDVSKENSSQSVQIIFSALRRTICEIGDKALARQGRDVTKHVIQIWLDLLNSMMKEHEWGRDKYLPRMNEYMSNAYISFALGPIVLPALYLVGPKISEEMVRHPEYHNLFKLMSTCGRLLNDMRTYEREAEDGKLNAVPLYIINNGGGTTKEEAIAEMKTSIESHRRELLRLVLDKKDSVIPKSCKDLFWHMSTVVHFFYSKDDGFTSQEMTRAVNETIYEPIAINEI